MTDKITKTIKQQGDLSKSSALQKEMAKSAKLAADNRVLRAENADLKAKVKQLEENMSEGRNSTLESTFPNSVKHLPVSGRKSKGPSKNISSDDEDRLVHMQSPSSSPPKQRHQKEQKQRPALCETAHQKSGSKAPFKCFWPWQTSCFPIKICRCLRRIFHIF
jgi:hypothetical protein